MILSPNQGKALQTPERDSPVLGWGGSSGLVANGIGHWLQRAVKLTINIQTEVQGDQGHTDMETER